MKIALIGYGKMGRIIEQVALQRGHEIVAIIDPHSPHCPLPTPHCPLPIAHCPLPPADVAIEFSVPAAAEANVLSALRQGVSVVCGTTGWPEGLARVKNEIPEGVALMWSGNYSLGVNLFFAANRFIAKMMAKFPQYSPDMTEVHHVHKLDHPSGTALMAAEQIIDALPALDGWSETPAEGKLLINHIRHAEVPGIHRVTWDSPVDSLTLEHSAKSRAGFALGAVMAAEWLSGKSGFHSIDEMMNEIIEK